MSNQLDSNTIQEILDCIDKIKKLEEQINNPSREKMIDALLDAKMSAIFEIGAIEIAQENYVIMSPQNFSDAELYEKLVPYRNGIVCHCIRKVGEDFFRSLYNK
ncbi:hypothetical protein ACQ9ZF_11740 (plasmid) [Cetobacterium somerae]|uniref:hypothetical protein n=1 Tax=Cetobacterium somerae TaxID=188913 RepID=UPI003D767543